MVHVPTVTQQTAHRFIIHCSQTSFFLISDHFLFEVKIQNASFHISNPHFNVTISALRSELASFFSLFFSENSNMNHVVTLQLSASSLSCRELVQFHDSQIDAWSNR